MDKTFIVDLSSKQRLELEGLADRAETDPLLKRRAHILLLADHSSSGPGHDDAAIMKELQVGHALVARTRQRFVEKGLDSALKRQPALLLEAPPMVARPQDDSVGLSLLAGALPIEIEIRLGAEEQVTRHGLDAGESRLVTLGGLTAGSEYTYHLSARNGERREKYSGRFTTRRPAGTTFRFAVFGDAHLPALAPKRWFRGNPGAAIGALIAYGKRRAEVGSTLRQVMDSIRAEEVDFAIGLGDLVHLWTQEPEPGNPLADPDKAYLDLRNHLGKTTSETAFFATLGNWEGESGWVTEEARNKARQARRKHVPNPAADTYPEGAGSGDNYFAWSWGDALFVVLDVCGHTPTSNRLTDGGSPQAWTLGSEQMSWLEETLRDSQQAVKMIFMHHPAGGRAGDAENSAYGRGGGRAAKVGEQEKIHLLMKETGVQVLFHGHDHVFTDMVVDGVHYTQPGSAGAPWKFKAEVTGYESFDPRSGYGLVEVGPKHVTVELRDEKNQAFDGYEIELS